MQPAEPGAVAVGQRQEAGGVRDRGHWLAGAAHERMRLGVVVETEGVTQLVGDHMPGR
ncbi:MAG: hypothetical protein ABGY72_22370 [bacterium]